MARNTLTPLFTLSPFYKNISYDLEEILELKEILLSEEEKRKYDKMNPTTPKQAFMTLIMLIDLTSVRKK